MLRQDHAGLTPGAHLRAEIERLGLDQVAVARATGVSRQTINNIVNDHQTISRAMAGKLGRVTGRSSDYWLRAAFSNSSFGAESHEAGELRPGNVQVGHADVRPGSVLVDHQIVRAIENGLIVVDPFEPGNVRRASLDLTLDDFIINMDGDEIDISDGQSFVLDGGQTVNVGTRECLEFPLDHVGRVGAMTEFAKFGIILAHGFQIDPGYRGHLQFCVFNAGSRRFELRGGEPIISLEIMPLAAIPTARASHPGRLPLPQNRDDAAAYFRNRDSRDALRELLRSYVKTSELHGTPERPVAAKIPELEIDIAESSMERAISAAMSSALETLKVVRSNQTRTELGDKYEAFFGRLSDRLYLSAEQARHAIASLGLGGRNAGQSIVKLRGGSSTILQLPPASARISLSNFARQLREEPSDLILMLSGLLPYA